MSQLADLLRKGLEANPNDWSVRRSLLEELAKSDDDGPLIETIKDAPEAADEATALSVASILASSPKAVALLLEKAVDAAPTSSALHAAMAKSKIAGGDMEGASTHYTAAKTFDPTFSDPDLDAVARIVSGGSDTPVKEAAEKQPAPVDAVVPVSAAPAAAPEPVPTPVEEVVSEVVPVAPAAPPAAPAEVEVPEVVEVEDSAEVVTPVDLHDPSLPAPPQEVVVAPAVVESAPEPEIAEAEHPEVAEVAAPPAPAIAAPALAPPPMDTGLEGEALVGADGEYLEGEYPDLPPAIAERDDTKEKLTGIVLGALICAGLIAVICLIPLVAPKVLPPEITAVSMSDTQVEEVVKKEVVQQAPTQPPAPAASVSKMIASTSASTVSVPTVDFDTPDQPIELGTTLGTGVTFGSSGAAGSEISFMGTSAKGNRVIFAVDFSLSMGSFGTEPQSYVQMKKVLDGKSKKGIKQTLVRHELIKAIKGLKKGTEYQIVMFSEFGWPHDAVKEEWLDHPDIYKKIGPSARYGKFLIDTLKKADVRSKSKKGASSLSDFDFPSRSKFDYLDVTPDNVKRSIDIIERTPMTFGTNWEHPILMALSMRPRPDVVFFMTDGAVGNPARALELVREANVSKAQINATAMMEPGAAKQLAQLAAEHGGQFSVVMEDRKVLTGEEFFKKNPNAK